MRLKGRLEAAAEPISPIPPIRRARRRVWLKGRAVTTPKVNLRLRAAAQPGIAIPVSPSIMAVPPRGIAADTVRHADHLPFGRAARIRRTGRSRLDRGPGRR